MIASFRACQLHGNIEAPPSKSMAHRHLIGAALAKGISQIKGLEYSEDILATIDCLRALGVKVTRNDDVICINPEGFMKELNRPVLKCRESGSTLRFFIPLALCLGKEVRFEGSTRLFERPLEVYRELCDEYHFMFKKEDDSLTVCGKLQSGTYRIRGGISSQFITGLIFALVYLGEDSEIQILPPFESRSYIDLTIDALNSFGANVRFTDEYRIAIRKTRMHSFKGEIEGDYSNAAFLDAYNYVGSSVKISNLRVDSLQGDRIYKEYFEKIATGTPILDISDCPDLGPILIALAALKNGATFTGTKRLKIKESDRGRAMKEELEKFGGRLVLGEDNIVVPKQKLKYQDMALSGHNDHRIIMALSLIMSKTGGEIDGVDAVKKSYPGYFEDIKKLGADVTVK